MIIHIFRYIVYFWNVKNVIKKLIFLDLKALMSFLNGIFKNTFRTFL